MRFMISGAFKDEMDNLFQAGSNNKKDKLAQK
jgi:hypothetical protein